MKISMLRIGVLAIASVMCLSVVTGCKDNNDKNNKDNKSAASEFQPLATSPNRVREFEYWVNPDLSAKVRVSLISPMSSIQDYRFQILRLLTNTPGVEAWSDMEFQLVDGQGTFSAIAWVPDLRKLKFGNTHLIPSRRGDDEMVLSVQFGQRTTKASDPPKSSPSNRTDEEIKQAVKTLRAEVDKETMKMLSAMGKFGFPASRIIVHVPGKLTKSKNFRQESDGSLSVEFWYQDILLAFNQVFQHNDEVAEKLVRETNATSARHLRKQPAVRDVALTQIWGQPGMPELTIADLSNVKPLFDYSIGVEAAKAIAFDSQLAKIGVIKLSLPPATEPPAVQFAEDSISFEMRIDKRTGKPKRHLRIRTTFDQEPANHPRVILHRIVDGNGRILFPRIGIDVFAGLGSYGSTKGLFHSVNIDMVGDIEPSPKTIDVLAEVSYATGTKRKINLDFAAIELGATDDKVYNARITKLDRKDERCVIHVTFNIPEGVRIMSVDFEYDAQKRTGKKGRKKNRLFRSGGVRPDRPGPGSVECMRDIPAEKFSRIKTVYAVVIENYQEHVAPMHLQGIPIKE